MSIMILDGARRIPRADILINNRQPGLFSAYTTTQLGGKAVAATLEHTDVDQALVGHCVMGMAQHSHRDSIYAAKGMAWRGGLAKDVPALTVARICGSGAEAVAVGAEIMLAGVRHDHDRPFSVVGGAESMQYPFCLYNQRGKKVGGAVQKYGPITSGKFVLQDMLLMSLYDPSAKMAMANTAEELARRYEISRQEADAFGHRSHVLAKKARDAGDWDEEITPLDDVKHDTHIMDKVSLAKMARLPAAFESGGIVTAGNASAVVDGAAAMVIGREEDVKEHDAKPLARVAGMGVAACDSRIMGWGPVPATKKALASAGIDGKQIDHVELNEAFAPQAIAVIRDFEKDMSIDPEKVKPDGRRHRARSSARCDWCDPDADMRLRLAPQQAALWSGDDVHRRRARHRARVGGSLMPLSRWTLDQVGSLQGKTIVVTGANSGIGLEALKIFAKNGAHIVMACRTKSKAEAAADSVMREHPDASLDIRELDLASLSSRFGISPPAFDRDHERLDVLCNNAGVMATPFRQTADGFEMQIGTNHFGHFALTGLLLGKLLATEQSRVVSVSSYMHHVGKMSFDDLQSERSYNTWAAYGQSKLANLLFTYELDRKLRASQASTIAVACHPGYAATNLQSAGPAMAGASPHVARSQLHQRRDRTIGHDGRTAHGLRRDRQGRRLGRLRRSRRFHANVGVSGQGRVEQALARSRRRRRAVAPFRAAHRRGLQRARLNHHGLGRSARDRQPNSSLISPLTSPRVLPW